MKVALLMKSKVLPKSADNPAQAIVFDVEKSKVVGVENDTLESKDLHAITSWAITRKIKEIFSPSVNEQHRQHLGREGIELKSYDELEEDSLFRTFIFS
jgi:hypothetical protein